MNYEPSGSSSGDKKPKPGEDSSQEMEATVSTSPPEPEPSCSHHQSASSSDQNSSAPKQNSSAEKSLDFKSKIAKRNYRSRSAAAHSPSPTQQDSAVLSTVTNTTKVASASSSSSSSSATSSDSDSSVAAPTPSSRSRRKRNRLHLVDRPNEELITALSAGLFHPEEDGNPLDSDTDPNRESEDDDEDGEENVDAEDDDDESMSSLDNSDGDDRAAKVNLDFLSNPKGKYRFCAPRDILYRQSGLAFNRTGRVGPARDPGYFQRHASGCRFAVEKMELMYKLKGHEGCVNSLNFNSSGSLLVSGSDDLKIMLWKWSSNEMVYQFESTHLTNVFQTKFMDLGGGGSRSLTSIHIISSSRDGYVVHHELPSSGGNPVSTSLIKHTMPVHKICLPETSPFEVLTAGEDGYVIRCDLRENLNERLITAKVNNRRMALYSIASHPLKNEFCVSGRNQFVRAYDRRNLKRVMRTYCPPHLLNMGSARQIPNITAAVYNYLGDEILASYGDDDIYLFDANNATPGSYLHKYQGHQNACTIKGVNFFGPRSEFVMSGSDCGSCFFWDKQNESIVQWMAGDEKGAVNVLEPHPAFPFVATSGIDDDIKIWVSSSEKPTTMEGLKKCVQDNFDSRHESSDMMGNEILSFFMRQCMRRTGNRERSSRNQQLVADLISSSSSSDEDGAHGDSTTQKLRELPCAPS